MTLCGNFVYFFTDSRQALVSRSFRKSRTRYVSSGSTYSIAHSIGPARLCGNNESALLEGGILIVCLDYGAFFSITTPFRSRFLSYSVRRERHLQQAPRCGRQYFQLKR